MVNLGFNLTTIFSLLDIFGAVGYLILTIASITDGVKRATSPVNTILKVIELLYCPFALFLSGVILFFNGWRLDPILQLQQLFLHLIVATSVIKELKNLLTANN